MAYVAMYSPRPGAASSRWADNVPLDEKKRRLHVLSEELHRTAGDYNTRLVGKTLRVLVTGPDRKPGFLSGRTEGRIPVRLPATAGVAVGRFADVTVTSAQSLSIAGEISKRPNRSDRWQLGACLDRLPLRHSDVVSTRPRLSPSSRTLSTADGRSFPLTIRRMCMSSTPAPLPTRATERAGIPSTARQEAAVWS